MGSHRHLTMGNEQSQPAGYGYIERQMSNATGKDVSTLQNFYSDFQKECPSGMLTPQKFTELCEKVLGSSKAAEFKSKAFGQFDKHSNGSPEDKLRTMFSLYDKDGNGSIDASEMESVLRDVYQMMGECEFGQGKAMFEMMDKDSDGKITEAEFIKASMEDVELCRMLAMKA